MVLQINKLLMHYKVKVYIHHQVLVHQRQQAPNIINQQLQTGGGGDNNFGGQGIGAFGNLDPNTKQTMQVEIADGTGGVEIKEVDTYLDAGGMRKTLGNKNPVNAGIDVKPLAVGKC